ncbi:MAG TPA: hypothetical protein VFE10_09570 [Phenylobacterium sp.]|nr:hypothetical protein [Phenylobacterium sp.]
MNTEIFGLHGETSDPMTAEQCHERASQCAANAGLALSEPVALEFLRMAAQWRAMAVRTIFLGSVEAGPEATVSGVSPSRLTK